MNRIRQLRKEKNITQVRLSIELEVSQETISAYEKEKHFPSTNSLIRLRDIFGVSIDYILGLSDVRYNPLLKSDLNEDELGILTLYRKMDASQRERAFSYLEGYFTALQDTKPSQEYAIALRQLICFAKEKPCREKSLSARL